MALATTTVWEIRTDGNDSNGGGFNAARDAVNGVDYTLRETPILTLTDIYRTVASTIYSDTGGFTAAMAGNLIFLGTGDHFTSGWYEIVTVSSANQVVLDRDPATENTSAHKNVTGNVGGALATLGRMGFMFQTVAQTASGYKVYIENGRYNYTTATVNVSGGRFDQDASQQDGKSLHIKGYDPAYGRDSFLGTRPLFHTNGVTFTDSTRLLAIKGASGVPTTVSFLEINAESWGVTCFYALFATYNRVFRCIATGGWYGFYGVNTLHCKSIDQVPGYPSFYQCESYFCYANAHGAATSTGYSYCTAVHCIAVNYVDGFSIGAYTNCTAYNSSSDGFFANGDNVRPLVNCVAWLSGAYSFNVLATTIMVNCAGGSHGTARTPQAQMIDVGDPGTLTVNPFRDPDAEDFMPDTDEGGGMLLRGMGIDPYGQDAALDIGAVQHEAEMMSSGSSLSSPSSPSSPSSDSSPSSGSSISTSSSSSPSDQSSVSSTSSSSSSGSSSGVIDLPDGVSMVVSGPAGSSVASVGPDHKTVSYPV